MGFIPGRLLMIIIVGLQILSLAFACSSPVGGMLVGVSGLWPFIICIYIINTTSSGTLIQTREIVFISEP